MNVFIKILHEIYLFFLRQRFPNFLESLPKSR